MTDGDLNITLNVATLPRAKSKAKIGHVDQSNAGEGKTPVKGIVKDIGAPSKSILKNKKGDSKSVWKTFKKVNKKPDIVPVLSNRKLDRNPKNVSFDYLNDDNETEDNENGGNVKKKKPSVNTLRNDLNSGFRPGHRPGKHTSLFGNNPEIPHVAHRAVKPLKEPVFSNLCFKDMALHPYMVKYLDESMGLTKMTTVQQKSIPVLLNKKDALIRSQTGSGKTLAFALPILHDLQQITPKISRTDGVMALIVAPTRELALQIYELFDKLVKSYTWIVPGCLIGGEKRKSEKARLRKGISILIGTPGRLVDHIQNTSSLTLDKVAWLVLDEADRLFDMGYEKDVSSIIASLDKGKTTLLNPDYINPDAKASNERNRQTVLLSATLTSKVVELAGLSLTDPVFVDACDESKSDTVPIFTGENNMAEVVALPESLVQQYVVVPAKLRLVTLSAFILWKCKLTTERKMLVFLATQDMVDYHTRLLSTGLVGCDDPDSDGESSPTTSGVEYFKLHGSMNQKERTEVFNTFRKAESGVLFCTDVAARGLDLPEVDCVVQYTGPISVPDYVHRVGRTARGGQSGSSVIFLLPSEVGFISELENHRIRLVEVKMEKYISNLRTFFSEYPNAEASASALQTALEDVVSEQDDLRECACKAYSSWSRFYASYPRNMKKSFNIKAVHQGHYAKSFALRDAPSAVINHAKGRRLNVIKSNRDWKERKKSSGMKRENNVSEFDSGLEPIRKKRR